MVRIASLKETVDASYDLGACGGPCTKVSRYISDIYGLKLVVVTDRDSLNAVDLLFHERLGCTGSDLLPARTPEVQSTHESSSSAEGDNHNSRLASLIQAVCQSQNLIRRARQERAVLVSQRLEKKTVDRDGAELVYFSGGTTGVPVIIGNALGQPLHYWDRLLDRLMEHSRVIIWEMRGLSGPPLTVDDQVSDMEAILRKEAITACHLLGWCTGGKTTIAFGIRHPEMVRSIALLNCGYICKGTPQYLETDYERNLESLLQFVCRNPDKISLVIKLLKDVVGTGAQVSGHSESKQLALNALSATNVNLRQHILAPFKSEASTLNYAYQALDFWSWDTTENAKKLQTPVLVIGAEYDKVASPRMAQAIASLFPNGHYVEVKSATHYSQYDYPELIVTLLESFFRHVMDLDQSRWHREPIMIMPGVAPRQN